MQKKWACLFICIFLLTGCVTPASEDQSDSKGVLQQSAVAEEMSSSEPAEEMSHSEPAAEDVRPSEPAYVPGYLEPDTIGTACRGEMPAFPADFEMLEYAAGDIYIRKDSPEEGYEDGYIYYRLVHTNWKKGEDGSYLGRQEYNKDPEMLWEKDPYYSYSQDLSVGEGKDAIQLHIEGLVNLIWEPGCRQMIQFRSVADDLGPRKTMMINYTIWMEVPFRTASGETRHYWVFWDPEMQCFHPFAEQSHLWEAAIEENYTLEVEEIERSEAGLEKVAVYFAGDSGRRLRLLGEPSQGIVVPADDPILLREDPGDEQGETAIRPATISEDGVYSIDLHGNTFRFRTDFDGNMPAAVSADPGAPVKAEYTLHHYLDSTWLELNAPITEQTVYPSDVTYYLYWNKASGRFEDALWRTDIWYRSLESPLTIVDIRTDDIDSESARLLFKNERQQYYFLDLMIMREAFLINQQAWGIGRNASDDPTGAEYAIQSQPAFVTLQEDGVTAVYDAKKVDALSGDEAEVYEPAEEHKRSSAWFGYLQSDYSINRINALSLLIIGDPGLYRFIVEDMGDPDVRHYTGMVYSPKEGCSKEIVFTDDLAGVHIHEFCLNPGDEAAETEWMKINVGGEAVMVPYPPEDKQILRMPGSPHLYSRRRIPYKPGYSEGSGYYVLQGDAWVEVPETELVQTFTIRGIEYEAHMLLTVDDGYLLQIRKQKIFAEDSEYDTHYLLTYRDGFAFLEIRPAYADLGTIDPVRNVYFPWNSETGQFDDIFADSNYWDIAKDEVLTLQSVSEDGTVFIFEGTSGNGTTNNYRVEWPEMRFVQMKQEEEDLGRH